MNNSNGVAGATKCGFLIGLLVLMPGCWSSKKEESQKESLVVINVLDKSLYDDCHIKDSINVPFEMIEEYARGLDKNTNIVLYCSNYQCSTSEYAAQKLRQQGFANVCVYEGGMAEWFQYGLPIEGPHQQAYLCKTCKITTVPVADVSEQQEVQRVTESGVAVITVHDLACKMGLCTKCDNAAA